MNRMKRGDVYSDEKVEQSFAIFSAAGTLSPFANLPCARSQNKSTAASNPTWDAKDIRENWGVRERIAVCISGNPSGAVSDRPRRHAWRARWTPTLVVHVERELPPREKNPKVLEANMRFAENLGAAVIKLKGSQCRRHHFGLCSG